MNPAERGMEEIYLAYHDRVLRYVRARIPNLQEAEDVCSGIFLKLLNGLPGYEPSRASLTTWVYTVTRNAVTDHFRRLRPGAPLEETLPFQEEGYEQILREETLEELAAALEELPVRERDVILLHYYSGRTLKELAAEMGMSYSNVKLLHSKALTHLRQRMDLPE